MRRKGGRAPAGSIDSDPVGTAVILLDQLPYAAFVHRFGALLFANAAAAELLRAGKPEALVGLSPRDIVTPQSLETLERYLAESASERLPRFLELTLLRRDGTTVDIEGTELPFLFHGEPAFLVLLHDLTERRRAQEAARKNEAAFRALMQSEHDVAYIVDAEGRLTFISPSLERLTGWLPSDWVGRPFAEIVHADDVARATAMFRQTLAGLCHPIYTARVRCKDGGYKIGEFSAVPIFDGDRVAQSFGIARDVTELHEAIEAVSDRERRFELALEAAKTGVWEWRLDTNTAYASRHCAEIFGFPAETPFSNDLFMRSVLPEDLAEVQAAAERAFRDGQEYRNEFRVRGQDGSVRWVSNFSRPVFGANGAPERLVGSLVDITAQKEAERELALTEARYRDLFEAINDAVILVAADGRVLDANETTCTRLGRTRAELLTLTLGDIDSDEFSARVPERMEALHRDGAAVFESAHRRADGTLMPVEISARTITYRGAPAILSVARDITERRAAQAALHESERTYRSLFETSWDAILVTEHGQFVDCNDAAVRLFGYPDKPSILQRGPAEMLPARQPDGRDSAAIAEQHLKAAEERGSEVFEQIHQRADGTLFEAEVLLSRIELKGRRLIQGIVRDLTARKAAEAAVRRHAEELEQFNRLAVGRELRMIELKREVNDLSVRLGLAPPYPARSADRKAS